MAKQAYWQRVRLSRRSLLGASAGAAALAFLGCGTGGSRPNAGSGLVNQPVNRMADARPGGTLKTFITADVPTFDPMAANAGSSLTLIAALAYPRLLKFSTAAYPARAAGAVEGDLADSFEFSPDRLTLTLRLRQGLRWDPKPPSSSRFIDAQDVVFSWNRYTRLSPSRFDLAYQPDLAPGSPFDSIASPDPRTVVFRLKQPDSSAPGLLASERHFYVVPREADSGFDPRYEIRGYGPWQMAENRSGSLRAWSKNPDYHVKGRPYPERLEQAMVPDYASRLAQFKAGLTWTSVVTPNDVLRTKRELPDLLLQKADNFATAPSSLAFGYDGDSPWKDERLRQAVSLLLDRETLINLKTNRADYEAQGLPLEVRYHTAIAAGWEGYWVDPKSDAFGPNGGYYGFDPEEARRLQAAAGYPEGVDTLLHYDGGNEYGPGYTRNAELLSGMLSEGGIRARLDPHAYQDDWLPNFHLGYAGTANVGKQIRGFPGLIFRPVTAYPTPATQAYSTMHRFGSKFHGMTPDGRNAALGDPDANRFLESMRREFDQKLEQAIALDFARFMARKAYDIPMLPHAALPYTLTWPVLANFGAFTGYPSGNPFVEANLNIWIDSSKPPLTPKPS